MRQLLKFIAMLLVSSNIYAVGFATEKNNIDDKFYEAEYLIHKGEFKKASTLLISTYKKAENQFPNEYGLSNYAYYVAAVHQNAGKYDIAEKYHYKNLAIKRRFLKDTKDPRLVLAINNVGSVLVLKKKYTETINVLSEIDLTKTIKEHSFVYFNLANSYFHKGNLELSEKYNSSSLKLVLKYYGKNTRGYADVHFLNAKIQHAKGNNQLAIKYAIESKNILKKIKLTNNILYKRINAFIKDP